MFLASDFFVVQTNPQRETFVVDQLGFLNPYLPRFKNLKGRIAPLFPGYLFLPALENWPSVCSIAGVRTLLKCGDHPAIIPGKVISSWKAKERGGLVQLPPPPRFRPGQRLTILRGSLKYRSVVHAGMIGKDRERVLIDMLGSHVSLIVASQDLAPELGSTTRNRLPSRRETLTGQRSGRFLHAVA